MQLRTHPKIRWSGSASWPPQWVAPYGLKGGAPAGEVGVLKDVRLVRLSPSLPAQLVLVTAYQEVGLTGVLSIDDQDFLQALFVMLQCRIGWSLRDIGDQTIDF